MTNVKFKIMSIVMAVLLISQGTYYYTSFNKKASELESYKTQLEQSQTKLELTQNHLDQKQIQLDIIQEDKAVLVNKIDELESIEYRIISTEKAESSRIQGYTLLEEHLIDVDQDSVDERVELYSDVEVTDDGVYCWDDGQRWLLLVRDEDQVYVLFDDYVQLGRLELLLYEFYESGEVNITTIQIMSAGLFIKDYALDTENAHFVERIVLDKRNIMNISDL